MQHSWADSCAPAGASNATHWPTSRRLTRVVPEQAAEAFFADNGFGRDGADPFRRLSAGERPVVPAPARMTAVITNLVPCQLGELSTGGLALWRLEHLTRQLTA